MKNVVIYINGGPNIETLSSAVLSACADGDRLHVIYQLSRVKMESIPLIGDLKEIRLQKARRKIIEWFESLELQEVTCFPLVYEQRVGVKQLKADLPQSDELVVLGTEEQEQFLCQLFQPLTRDLEVQYIFKEGGQTNEKQALS